MESFLLVPYFGFKGLAEHTEVITDTHTDAHTHVEN